MSQDIHKIAEHAMEQALKLGAAQVAARVSQRRFSSVKVRDRKIDKLAASTSASLSLSLYVDGRYSSNSTSDLRPASVAAFCEQLVAMTRLLAPDAHRALPDPSLYQGRRQLDLHIFDPAHWALDMSRRKAYARAVEDAALAASDKVVSVTSEFYDSTSEVVLLHSNGFVGRRQSTDFWGGASASVRGQGDKKPSDWASKGARFLADLPPPEQAGAEAVRRALDHVGAAKLASARLPMIIENRAVGSLLRHILGAMRAASIQQERSFLAAKLGQKIGGDKLHLVDDPFVDKGFGSRLFDSEGLSARRLPLFEAGVLKNYYVDVYYGRKLGMAPTTAGASNLVFEGGEGDLATLMQPVERGVLVRSFIGGNASPVTGDFSLGIRGHLIEKGQPSSAIAEMNITGDLRRLLAQLDAVGADAYPYSSKRTPSLRFAAVQFSGA